MKKGTLLSFLLVFVAVFCLLYFKTGAISAQNQEDIAVTETDSNEFNDSSASGMISRLKNVNPDRRHPRLMVSKENFEAIKDRLASDTVFANLYTNVKKAADKILKEPPVKYELPDGVRLLSISRKALDRIQTLALVYRISGDSVYAKRAWLELQTISGANSDQETYAFEDWHPVHFLDTAEMTNAAAIGYDWLYDYLSEEQRAVIRNAILEKGLNQAIPLYRSGKGFTKYNHNWNSVCNGGIAMGALAIGDEGEEFEAAAGEVLEGALVSIPVMLNEYAPDGGWTEGPGYWSYGTTYLGYFMAAMDKALGTDFGLSAQQGLSDTGSHPLYLTGPKGSFNFADGSEGVLKDAVLQWLAGKFNKTEYLTYRSTYMKKGDGKAMDVIWYVQEAEKKLPEAQDRYFAHVEAVGLHTDLMKPEDTFVGFKAGDNQANHCDLDIGSFVFDSLGVRWASDLGADNYNLPGYFDKGKSGKRWLYYRKRAEGHNTIVINPGQKPDQNPLAKSKIDRFMSSTDEAFAISDMTNAYTEDALSIKRGLHLFKKSGSLLIQDEIKNKKPSEVWWFMHTQAQAEVQETSKQVILTKDGKKVRASILSPAGATFEVLDGGPLSTSPNPERQNVNKGIKKLAIHLSKLMEERITVLIEPVTELQQEKIMIVPLKDW